MAADVCIVFTALLLLAAVASSATLFQDRTWASDFGPAMYLDTPLWVGATVLDGRTVDIDADGTLDLVVSMQRMSCIAPAYVVSAYVSMGTSKLIDRPDVFLAWSQPPEASNRVVDAMEFAAPLDAFFCLQSGELVQLAHPPGNLSYAQRPGAAVLPCAGGRFARFGSSVLYVGGAYSYMLQPLPNGTYADHAAAVFDPPPLLNETAIAFADLNGDGFGDVIATGLIGSSAAMLVYSANAAGNLSLTSSSLTPVFKGSVLAADLTGDGLPDVLLLGLDGTMTAITSLFINLGSFNFSAASLPGDVPGLFRGSAAAVTFAPASPAVHLAISGSQGSGLGYSAVLRSDGSGNYTSVPAQGLSAFTTAFVGTADVVPGFPGAVFVGVNANDPKSMSLMIDDDGSVRDISNSIVTSSKVLISLSSSYAAAVDFNADGCLDLAIQGYSIREFVRGFYTGDCEGKFSPFAVGLPAYAEGFAVWEDSNGDGNFELLATGAQYGTVTPGWFYMEFSGNSLIQNISASSGDLQSALPLWRSSAAFCDFTGDGKRDLLLLGSPDRVAYSSAALLNNGNLSYSDVSTRFSPAISGAYSGAIGCLPLDAAAASAGWADVLIGGFSSFPQLQYYSNGRNGSMIQMPTAAYFNGETLLLGRCSIAVGDVNADGRSDAVVMGYDFGTGLAPLLVFTRMANGTFAGGPIAGQTGLFYGDAELTDVDGDGLLDILAIGFEVGFVLSRRILKGLGNETFADAASMWWPANASFSFGKIVAAQFSSALDNQTDLFVVGQTESCGFRLLLQGNFSVAVNVSATSTSGIPSAPAASSSGLSTSALIAIIVSGGGSIAVLAMCCCILLCCVLCCILVVFTVFVILVVLLIVVAIPIVLGAAGIGAGGSGGAVLLMRRASKEVEDFPDELNAEELHAFAAGVDSYLSINRTELTYVKRLGSGAFGNVMMANWNGTEVAVKILQQVTKEALEDVKHETLMMAKVSHHPNMVRLLGLCVDDGEVAIVMALCSGGSLLAALEMRKVDTAMKIRVLCEVASAISFLHSLGIVHRDVAARNVLLDAHGVAKLSDLGMSRVLEDKRGEQMTNDSLGPIRWMSPESIRYRKYSSASDAYSFGTLIWEVWSDGAVPFSNISSLGDVAIAVVQREERPDIPLEIPVAHERAMRALWSQDPSQRPTMESIRASLAPKDDQSQNWGEVSTVFSAESNYYSINGTPHDDNAVME